MKKKNFLCFFLAITTMFFTFASPYIEYEVIREAELTQNPIPKFYKKEKYLIIIQNFYLGMKKSMVSIL